MYSPVTIVNQQIDKYRRPYYILKYSAFHLWIANFVKLDEGCQKYWRRNFVPHLKRNTNLVIFQLLLSKCDHFVAHVDNVQYTSCFKTLFPIENLLGCGDTDLVIY